MLVALFGKLSADTVQYQQDLSHRLSIEYSVDIEQPLPGGPLATHVDGHIDAHILARVTSDPEQRSSSLPDEVAITIDQWSGHSEVNGEFTRFGSELPEDAGLRYVPSATVRCGQAIKGRTLTFGVERDVKAPTALTIETAPELTQLYSEYPELERLLPPSFFVTVLEQVLAIGGVDVDSGTEHPLQVTIADGLAVPATFAVEKEGNRFRASVSADMKDLPMSSSTGQPKSSACVVNGDLRGTCEWQRTDALIARVKMEARYGTQLNHGPVTGPVKVSSRWTIDSVAR